MRIWVFLPEEWEKEAKHTGTLMSTCENIPLHKSIFCANTFIKLYFYYKLRRVYFSVVLETLFISL